MLILQRRGKLRWQNDLVRRMKINLSVRNLHTVRNPATHDALHLQRRATGIAWKRVVIDARRPLYVVADEPTLFDVGKGPILIKHGILGRRYKIKERRSPGH